MFQETVCAVAQSNIASFRVTLFVDRQQVNRIAKKSALAVGVAATAIALSGLAHSVFTRWAYAPKVAAYGRNIVRDTDRDKLKQAEEAFSRSWGGLLGFENPRDGPINQAGYITSPNWTQMIPIDGLKFHVYGKFLTTEEEQNLKQAVELLKKTDFPSGGNWLDALKATQPEISIKRTASPMGRYELQRSKPNVIRFDFMSPSDLSALTRAELALNGFRNIYEDEKRVRLEIDAEKLVERNKINHLLKKHRKNLAYVGYQLGWPKATLTINRGLLQDTGALSEGKWNVAKLLARQAAHGALDYNEQNLSPTSPDDRKHHALMALVAQSEFVKRAVMKRLLPASFWFLNEGGTAIDLAKTRLGIEPAQGAEKNEPPGMILFNNRIISGEQEVGKSKRKPQRKR